MPEPGMLDPEVPAARRVWRVRHLVAGLVAAGVTGWLLVGGLLGSVTYLQPVSEALAERDSVGDRRLRIAGEVRPGSIEAVRPGVVRFALTDGAATVFVEHEGSPPDLFEDGVPVVSEGSWDEGTFRADRLLIRHGNEYSPPDAERVPEPPR